MEIFITSILPLDTKNWKLFTNITQEQKCVLFNLFCY